MPFELSGPNAKKQTAPARSFLEARRRKGGGVGFPSRHRLAIAGDSWIEQRAGVHLQCGQSGRRTLWGTNVTDRRHCARRYFDHTTGVAHSGAAIIQKSRGRIGGQTNH